VRPDRPSRTAEMVCAWRAAEHLLPPARRLVDDPFARGFLGPARGALIDGLARLPSMALEPLVRRTDQVIGGSLTFVLARHRAIDDALVASTGHRQVVLLGAGYDSRIVRLADALAGRTLLEVDHPATAGRRAELAPAAFGSAPRATSRSITIDFTRESLEERLLEGGLDPAAPTFWIWEGVSMYLDEPAVRSTLDIVRRRSAPGSLLVFDAWCPPDGALFRLTRRDLPSLAFKLAFDEPLTWGPAPGKLGPLLAEHGLALLEEIGAAPLVERYVTGRRSRLSFPSSMVLVTAEVDRAR
jgi:methyltransferase (TIGR00027 family)